VRCGAILFVYPCRNIFRAYWSMAASWGLMAQHANDTGVAYDAVVLARPDVWFHADIDLPTKLFRRKFFQWVVRCSLVADGAPFLVWRFFVQQKDIFLHSFTPGRKQSIGARAGGCGR